MEYIGFDPFWLKLLASFLIGGFYAGYVVTRSSEYFGATFGGILSGMPSTVLISLIFIAWTQDSLAMRKAIPIIPVGLSVAAIYLMILVNFYKRSKFISFIGSLTVWSAILTPLVIVKIENILLSLSLTAVFLGSSIVILRKYSDKKPPKLVLSKRELLFRFIFSGSIISLAVFFGKIASPLWGGLITSFPAATFSAVMLLMGKYGQDFATSFIKGMTYGIISNIGFLVVLFLLVPRWGMWAMFPALVIPTLLGVYRFRRLNK